MPEVFREAGFRFFFYSDDHLPIHIHVMCGDVEAKFKVEATGAVLLSNYGFNAKELKKSKQLIEVNLDKIITCWIQYFG